MAKFSVDDLRALVEHIDLTPVHAKGEYTHATDENGVVWLYRDGQPFACMHPEQFEKLWRVE